MIISLISKIKGWWNKMFDYNKIVNDFDLDMQTSKDILNALQEWSNIYNGHEPWIDSETSSLHVARTMCDKVAKAVTIEYKSVCDEPYINEVYQKFLINKRTHVESMLGKSLIFFKPYFDGRNIKVNIVQGDKFIPVKIDDDGNLLGCIIVDQITKGSKVYTRLEYNELIEDKMTIKNIAYKGRIDGTVLETRIPLSEVDKWKKIVPEGSINGVDRLIGGLASMKNVNTIDNSYSCGTPIYHNALETLKEIDKQYSRILWEYEGTELAIDADETLLINSSNGKYRIPKRKERLFRKFDFEDTKDKSYNIFSPEIRDNPLFNGLNELLKQAENQCGLAHGTLSKLDEIVKTATEIRFTKQDYYVTVTDIQDSLQHAFDDLIYGIYVLCKIYGIPVKNDYTIEHDWDDSILIDKEAARNQSLIERNNGITSDVQYIMDTKGYKEKEAIEYVKRQKEYRKITEEKKETEVDEE